MQYTIKVYETATGKCPFKKWINSLSDLEARVSIELRIDRLRVGNFGKNKSLRSGLYELKIGVGPGYRIYFSKVGQEIVLLLCAGNKQSQLKDIVKAREYLDDYKKCESKNVQKSSQNKPTFH